MVKHIAENLKLVIKKTGGEIGQFVESFLKWLSCTGSLGRSGFNAWPGSAASSVNSFIWVFKGWACQTLVLNSGLYFFCSLFLQIQNNTSLPCWNVERIPDYLQGQQISFYLGTRQEDDIVHCLIIFIALQLFWGKQPREKIIPVKSELQKDWDGQLDWQEKAKAGSNTKNHHWTDILINITAANLLLTSGTALHLTSHFSQPLW